MAAKDETTGNKAYMKPSVRCKITFVMILRLPVDAHLPVCLLTFLLSCEGLGVLSRHCDWCPVALLQQWGTSIGALLSPPILPSACTPPTQPTSNTNFSPLLFRALPPSVGLNSIAVSLAQVCTPHYGRTSRFGPGGSLVFLFSLFSFLEYF